MKMQQLKIAQLDYISLPSLLFILGRKKIEALSFAACNKTRLALILHPQ
jgi:hypothetical protein